MIRISVEKYCENCGEFEPWAIKEGECFPNGEAKFNTTVVCTHAGRCAAMLKELKRRDAT